MILIVALVFELVSIAIYAIMSVHRCFGDIFRDWDRGLDVRPDTLCVMAIFGGWMFAPYFVWLAWKWIRKRGRK